MFISVLIPSNRPEFLKSVIQNLRGKDIEDFEIVVCISEGDFTTEQVCKDTGVKYTISKYTGYKYLWAYYNQMAEVAEGDFLFIYNDDVELPPNTNWVDILKKHLQRDKVNYFSNLQQFPIISRDLYKLFGHISLHCYVDDWLISLVGWGANKTNEFYFNMYHRFVSSNISDPVPIIQSFPGLMEKVEQDIELLKHF